MFCQEWEINELGSSPMLNNNLLPSSWCCPTPSHPTQHYLKSWSYSSPCYLKGDLLNIVLRIDLVFFFVSLPSTNPGSNISFPSANCANITFPLSPGTQAPCIHHSLFNYILAAPQCSNLRSLLPPIPQRI